MHSQACFLSYQLQDIHISLLWCSQPNRNTEMEPLLSFYIVLSFSFSPQFLLNFHFLNRGYWFTPFSLSKVIYLLLSHLSPMSYYTHVSLLHFSPHHFLHPVPLSLLHSSNTRQRETHPSPLWLHWLGLWREAQVERRSFIGMKPGQSLIHHSLRFTGPTPPSTALQ